jgi:FAD/FMN-containing dehydrogenase
MSIVVPAGSTTIAPWGGWMQGGGHSILASKYGLGADQVLSLQVVMADGSFVIANRETNQDLFFALRGGGPSKF